MESPPKQVKDPQDQHRMAAVPLPFASDGAESFPTEDAQQLSVGEPPWAISKFRTINLAFAAFTWERENRI